MTEDSGRLPVKKTYKLYVDGEYPRTESGRYIQIEDAEGNFLANICRASRKDFRAAVRAAGEAQTDWFARTPFNRGQILYRMAEMLESRREGMKEHLKSVTEYDEEEASEEVQSSIDRLVWYAGWTDKFEQVYGSTNPVASSHFNFTVPEPTGVVAAFLPQNSPLLGVVSGIAPIIASGNTVIGIVNNDAPTAAMEFAEVLNNSDLPGGVVNILTGYRDELRGHVGGHRDLDGVICYGPDSEDREQLALEGAENVKRVEFEEEATDWSDSSHQSPYKILPFVEFKTAWHPIGK